MGAIPAADTTSPSVTERLAEQEMIDAKIGQLIAHIDSELAALEQNRVDPADITAALNEVDQMLEVIWPRERGQ